jgi:hypothetical protein
MALHVLAYNLKRVINIIGIAPSQSRRKVIRCRTATFDVDPLFAI